jgi:hypothetical protein
MSVQEIVCSRQEELRYIGKLENRLRHMEKDLETLREQILVGNLMGSRR